MNTEWFEGRVFDDGAGDSVSNDQKHQLGFLARVGLWALVALLIVGTLPGCAMDRYLTAEEDAELRKNCEPYGGCVAVPMPVWKKIEILIRSVAGTGV